MPFKNWPSPAHIKWSHRPLDAAYEQTIRKLLGGVAAGDMRWEVADVGGCSRALARGASRPREQPEGGWLGAQVARELTSS